MMQKLFARKLRFTLPNGAPFPAWKVKRFDSLFEFIPTNSYSRDALTYSKGKIQNIHYGDIHGKFRSQFHQERETVPFIKPGFLTREMPNQQFCKKGDLVIADASEDYADIGKAIEIISVTKNSLVAGLHTFIARPKSQEIATGYPGYLFQTFAMRRQIMRIAQGISVLGISKSKLGELTLPLPDPEEQSRIADALSVLDDKIHAVGDQIEGMLALKKSLMQRMFV